MPSATMRWVIELVVVVFVVAYLLPPAITAIMMAETTGWNPAVISIFTVLFPILIIVSIALALMPSEIKSRIGI